MLQEVWQSAAIFQVHAGAGVQVYLTEHVFIRPQFDLHYVPNFTNQFGSSMAPGAMVWIGYAERDGSRAVRPVAQAGYEEGYL